MENLRADVWRAIYDAGLRGAAVKQLVEASGASVRTVRKHLADLLAEEKVVREEVETPPYRVVWIAVEHRR